MKGSLDPSSLFLWNKKALNAGEKGKNHCFPEGNGEHLLQPGEKGEENQPFQPGGGAVTLRR